MKYTHERMSPGELCTIREEMRWTWEEMAEQLGITSRALYFYADGTRCPTRPLARLLRILSGQEPVPEIKREKIKSYIGDPSH